MYPSSSRAPVHCHPRVHPGATPGSDSTTAHPFTPAHDTYSSHANTRANSLIHSAMSEMLGPGGPKADAPSPRRETAALAATPAEVRVDGYLGTTFEGSQVGQGYSGVVDRRRLVHHACTPGVVSANVDRRQGSRGTVVHQTSEQLVSPLPVIVSDGPVASSPSPGSGVRAAQRDTRSLLSS